MAHLLTFRQCKQIIIIKSNVIFPVIFTDANSTLMDTHRYESKWIAWLLDVPGRSGIFKSQLSSQNK